MVEMVEVSVGSVEVSAACEGVELVTCSVEVSAVCVGAAGR